MKTRKMIETAIMFAIDALVNSIKDGTAVDETTTANNIKTLAEAYDLVHRGNWGEREC
jgi:hypothetical protein